MQVTREQIRILKCGPVFKEFESSGDEGTGTRVVEAQTTYCETLFASRGRQEGES